jgi:hypothetical protein
MATDREHLQAIMAAEQMVVDLYGFPNVSTHEMAVVIEDRSNAFAAAKQHLDTTKPECGGAVEAAGPYRVGDELAGLELTIRGDAEIANAAYFAGHLDGARSGVAAYAETERDLAAITTTPSPNEAEIRADERRRIDELAASLFSFYYDPSYELNLRAVYDPHPDRPNGATEFFTSDNGFVAALEAAATNTPSEEAE